jgi:hypothetical protein
MISVDIREQFTVNTIVMGLPIFVAMTLVSIKKKSYGQEPTISGVI